MRKRALPAMIMGVAVMVLGALAGTAQAQLEAETRGGSALYRGLDVNIQDGSRLALLHVAFEVQCVSERAAEEVASPRMREAIVLFLRGKTVAQLRSPLDKRRLKRELLDVINKELGAPRAVRIYMTQFVVQ